MAIISFLPIGIAVEELLPQIKDTILDTALALFWAFGSGYIIFFHAKWFHKNIKR